MGNHTEPQDGPHEDTAPFLQMSEPPSAKSHAGHLARVTHGAARDCSHWVHREGGMKPATESFTTSMYTPFSSAHLTHAPC